MLGGLKCCCGNADCSFCSDNVSVKSIQVTLASMSPAGSCADMDGVYATLTTPMDMSLPWLDDPATTATTQDASYPLNVLTLPKHTGTTLDSGVCSWEFPIGSAPYSPVTGACAACSGACDMDYSGVDGNPCDPLVPSDCDGGSPGSPACDAGGHPCDCLGFRTYECLADCTQPGDSLPNPCCTCAYDGISSWLCGCTGTAAGGNPSIDNVYGTIYLYVYKNSVNDVVVYGLVIVQNATLGNLQIYSGEHVFTGKTS